MKIRNSKQRKGMRGQSLIEFSFSLPILLMLTLGTVDIGSMIYTTHRLSSAVREGAKIASESTSEDGLFDAARTRTQKTLTKSGLPWWHEGTTVEEPKWRAVPNPDPSKNTEFRYVEVNASLQGQPGFFQGLLGSGGNPQPLRAQALGFFDERIRNLVSDWGGSSGSDGDSDPTNDTDVIDDAGGNNGRLEGGAYLLANQRFGQVIHFDGKDDYVEVPHRTSQLLPNEGGAFMAWVNFSSLNIGQAQGIPIGGRGYHSNLGSSFSYGLGVVNSCYGERCSSLKNQFIAHLGDGGEKDRLISSAVVVQPDTWYQVILTWTAKTMYLYVNGVKIGEMTRTTELSYVVDDDRYRDEITLGRYHGWPYDERYFHGSMADIMIFDATLSDYDIDFLYREGGGA